MKTIILDVVIKALVPLFLLFSFYMFFRGHDHPGGGFIGGLVATIPFMVHAITFGPEATRLVFKIKPVFAAGLGLGIALISGFFALGAGEPFMKGLWTILDIFFLEKIGSPVLFDAGVFLVVFGVTMQVTFLFSERS